VVALGGRTARECRNSPVNSRGGGIGFARHKVGKEHIGLFSEAGLFAPDAQSTRQVQVVGPCRVETAQLDECRVLPTDVVECIGIEAARHIILRMLGQVSGKDWHRLRRTTVAHEDLGTFLDQHVALRLAQFLQRRQGRQRQVGGEACLGGVGQTTQRCEVFARYGLIK
jgi:hypothetical protein